MAELIRGYAVQVEHGEVFVAERVATLEWERRYIERVRKVVGNEMFQQVPLSLLVHDFLVLLHRHGHLKGLRCTRGGAALALARALAHPHGWPGLNPRLPRAQWAALRGRIVIAGLHSQDRSRNRWQPLAEALGPRRCLLLAAGRSQLNQPPLELPRVALTQFPADWAATRAWLLARLPRWLRGLERVRVEFGFDPPARWRLAAELVAQVNRLGAVRHFHQRLRPRAAVVPWDREPFSATLCAMLETRGVPTVTFSHGAFGRQNRDSFVPLAARYAFTWGEVQTELLREAGVSAERLLPIGVFTPEPVRRALTSAGRAERLRPLGLDPDQPVVVVGLTCLTERDRPVWARVLRELADRLPGAAVLARLHPSNAREQFTGLLTEGPRLRLVDDRQLSAVQTLELADAVVVDSSSFGFDAVQRRLPVVVLWPPDGSGLLTVMREAVLEGAAVLVQDVTGAAQVLGRLLAEPVARAALTERAEAFTRRYVCAWGEEAVGRAVAALERIARPERP
jgi:hypothetical protein